MHRRVQTAFVVGVSIGSFFNYAYPNGAMALIALSCGFALAAFGSWRFLLMSFLCSSVTVAFSAKPYSGFSLGVPLVAFSAASSTLSLFVPLALARLLCVRHSTPNLAIVAVYPCIEVASSFAMAMLFGLGQSGHVGILAFRYRMLNKGPLPDSHAR